MSLVQLADKVAPGALGYDRNAAELLRHPPPGTDVGALHRLRIEWLEQTPGQVIAMASDYPSGYLVPTHQHGRSQLLYPLSGVVTVATSEGRWMVPPEHALWIPARVPHSVEMLGDVKMRSLYVIADAIRATREDSGWNTDEPMPTIAEAMISSQ